MVPAAAPRNVSVVASAPSAEQPFLQQSASRVHHGGEKREQQTGDVRALAGGGVHADQHHAEERDRRSDDERLGEPLSQEEPAEDHDHERGEVHDHGRRAGVERALGGVERQVVDAEPPDSPDRHEPPVATLGNTDAVAHGDDREHGAAHRHAQQRERPGIEVRARTPDADERRRPQHHGHDGRDEDQRTLCAGLRGIQVVVELRATGLRHPSILAPATDIGDAPERQHPLVFRQCVAVHPRKGPVTPLR